MNYKRILVAPVLLLTSIAAFATIFGSVRGVIHDPQHRPIQGARVTIKAQNSDWKQSQDSNNNGEFEFSSVPIGDYTVTVSLKDFQQTQQDVIVGSDTSPVLHFKLALAGVKQTVAVSETPVEATTESVTPTTTLNRIDIQQTPGADRTNGMEMITDYVPAAYVTHDMLHMRGGHQVEWLIDGVPIPNTNIANNLGPQIDPKDIDYLEVQRGSYDADYGDRTYGIFNVVPRTGFERDRECDLVIAVGNFYQTDNQISCGGHTARSAYYVSLNGNRSNYGLQPPIAQVFHDAANGYGGFASFIFNSDPKNQFRVVGSLRQDYFQIPYDPNPNSIGNQQLAQGGILPAMACVMASVSQMVMRRSRGFTRSIQTRCSPFHPSIITTVPTTEEAPTTFRLSQPLLRLPSTAECKPPSMPTSGGTIFRPASTDLASTNTTTFPTITQPRIRLRASLRRPQPSTVAWPLFSSTTNSKSRPG